MLLWIVKEIGTNCIGDLARGQSICRQVSSHFIYRIPDLEDYFDFWATCVK